MCVIFFLFFLFFFWGGGIMCIMGDVQVVYLKECELFICLHSSAMAVLYHVSVDAVDPGVLYFIFHSAKKLRRRHPSSIARSTILLQHVKMIH